MKSDYILTILMSVKGELVCPAICPVKPFETITVIKGYTNKMDSAATESS